jgi:hypothetical protein
MPFGKLKAHSEYIVAATAVFVSLTTLAVYIYQARVMKEQQKVSVWPYVETFSSNVKDFHISAKNKGVGPALIRKVDMSVDGKRVSSNYELITAVLGQEPPPGYINSSLEGRVMAPGEEITPFLIPDPKEGRAFEQKLAQHHFEWSITYCSVYGDCWVTSDDKVRRLPKVDLQLY